MTTRTTTTRARTTTTTTTTTTTRTSRTAFLFLTARAAGVACGLDLGLRTHALMLWELLCGLRNIVDLGWVNFSFQLHRTVPVV